MTLPRLYAFSEAWRLIPPLADTLAAIAHWAGAIKPQHKAPDANSPEAQEELGKILNGAQIQPRKRPA